jgi:hypothetical protein
LAQPFGTFYLLAVVLAKLEQCGCKITELTGEFEGPDGPTRIRYVRNPANNQFYILDDYTEDEALAPSTIANIERRLGVDLGLPP